jgi:hypothetical protein
MQAGEERLGLLNSAAPVELVDDVGGGAAPHSPLSAARLKAKRGSFIGSAVRSLLGGKEVEREPMLHSPALPSGANIYGITKQRRRKGKGWASRLCCCRLNRGTACWRFSLLFLTSLMVLNGASSQHRALWGRDYSGCALWSDVVAVCH